MSELKAYRPRELVMQGRHNEPIYLKSEADKVFAQKNAIIEEQAKEIKFMHQHCSHGERCGTSCAQIHGELMQATIEIAELKEELRWRKFPDEKPKEKQWILVYYGYENNGCRIDLRRWDEGCKFDVEFQELYTHWMPLPSAPKEER